MRILSGGFLVLLTACASAPTEQAAGTRTGRYGRSGTGRPPRERSRRDVGRSRRGYSRPGGVCHGRARGRQG